MTLAALVLATSIDAIFKDYDGAVPGASVVVIRGREMLFRKSYGLAEVEHAVAAKPDANYRLASMTKQFTAMAILTLAHRGKLSLDDRITRFFPEFPELGITVRQMLTHTSGLVDYEDVMPPNVTIPLKDFDVLWILQQQEKTLFQPGTKWQYSNSGYALLALIVEKVSGQTFARFLHDNLFEPAGMKSTLAYEKGLSTVPRRAFGYSRDGDGWKRTDQSLTSAVLGDGGVYSSVDDLTHWYAWLDKNPLYREASQPHAESYGYGWFVGTKGGRNAIWHTGETEGFRNAVLRLPDADLTVMLAIGVILLDAGEQASHISNQARIFSLDPALRNRLNAVYMVTFFIGGATGSLVAGYAWQHFGWTAVCGAGALFAIAGAVTAGRASDDVKATA